MLKKGVRTTNISLVIMTLLIAAMISCIGNATEQFHSQGRIVFTNGTDRTDDDVIFDAKDFEKLATVCK